MSFISHLERALCGRRYDANLLHNLCSSCQRPLWVRYDLAALRKKFSRKALFGRPPTLELLPIRDPAHIVTLTETIPPILHISQPINWAAV